MRLRGEAPEEPFGTIAGKRMELEVLSGKSHILKEGGDKF
jgi:hypothetical protein